MPRAAALNSAVRQELLDRNVAQLVQIPKQRKRKLVPWTSEEARRFLESARSSSDPLYAAYLLVLVLGLRKATTMSGRGSHASSDASVFVSRAGPVLRSSPGCRRGGRSVALGLVATGGDRRRGGLDRASAAHVHAVVGVGACHRHRHCCVVLAHAQQVM
jgi:integrase